MTKKGFWYAGALTIAISGAACAVQPGGGEPIRLAQVDIKYDITKAAELKIITTTTASCNPPGTGVCPVRITVEDGCSKHDPKGNPKIVASPEELRIPPERKGKPVAIVWRVATPKWKFQPNGIKFYSAGTEFQDKGNQSGAWVHIDMATTRDTYPYEINVVNTETGEKCKGDPTIFNDF
jgi:hypothetical protein